MSAENKAAHLTVMNLDLVCTDTDQILMPPEEIADVINTLLPRILDTVQAHHGRLESASNCTLVIIFSSTENHDMQAVQCSAKLHGEVRVFTESRVANGKRPVKLRIGIGTGEGLAQTYDHPLYCGNSHIGSTLVKAQMLKNLAPVGQTILSGDTYSSVHDQVSCRLIKQFQLKDYDEAIKAYEVLSAEEAAVLESQKDNRRKYPRLELNLPITLQVAQWSHRAEAINISAGGVLVACKDSFQTNTPVKLSAVLPLGKRELPLRIEGIVVHSTPKGDGRHAMGIKFKRLISEDREALEHLLSIILGEVLKDEDMHIDVGEDAAGIRFYAYEATALLDDIDL